MAEVWSLGQLKHHPSSQPDEENMNHTSLSSSDWIALSSGFVALIALVTTLWQARLTRTHNFLSCRPVLDIDSLSRADATIGLVIRNCGPGPAFISTATATFRKTTYSLTNAREFNAFATALVHAGLPVNQFSVSVAGAESVIAPGHTYELLLVTEKDDRRSISLKFGELMHEVRIEVTYKSLYSQSYKALYDFPIVSFT